MSWRSRVQRGMCGLVLLGACGLHGQTSGTDLMRRADTAFRAGNLGEAATLFEQALQSQSAPPLPAHMMLGLIRAQQGQSEQAAAHFQEVLKLEPDNPHAHFYLGRVLAEQHDWTNAVASLRRARDLQNTNPAPHQELIRVLLSAGEPNAALTEAIAAQRRFPDHAGIQYFFGLAGYRVPETPFTKLALRNLRDAEPSDPRVLVLQGLVSMRAARMEEARVVLMKAKELGVPEAIGLLAELKP